MVEGEVGGWCMVEGEEEELVTVESTGLSGLVTRTPPYHTTSITATGTTSQGMALSHTTVKLVQNRTMDGDRRKLVPNGNTRPVFG